MTNGEQERPCILVVDDIPDTVDLLRDWLENHNYRTLGVTSSLQAIQVAVEQRPDLILLDVMMPKMDGIETCRQLKANPRTSSIPVILVTAKNPSDARSEGIMAGAVDYITKPVNLHDLVRRIEAALSTNVQAPVDVERLLEEVAHSALTILQPDMVWLLGLDDDDQLLKSRILASTSGSRAETDFLRLAGGEHPVPQYPLHDAGNILCDTVISRSTHINLPVDTLADYAGTQQLFQALRMLRVNFITLVPLTAAGKTTGVMVLGSFQPLNMESPRARQGLTSLGSQAAMALDYSRLITNLTQRERDMQREQAFREMILDTMSDGLVVIDSKGTIKYVNRRLLRMTNYPRGYLEGRSVGELFHPEDRVSVMIGLLREGAATLKFDQRLITRDNRVIPVWLTRSRAHSDDLNNQVIVLSDMTQQKQREIELERQTNRLLALNRAAHVIASNLSLHETLRNILDAAMDVVEAQGASLFLFNKENPNELIVVAAVGSGADILHGMRVPVGEGIAGWVAREARSQLVADTSQDPRFYRGVDDQTGMSTRSLIAVPLITADKVIGVVEVVNKLNDGFFDENDVHLLESMAGSAAISIINARLFDETQRRVRELATMLNASAAASSTLQFAEVLESIVRSLAHGLDAARCTIMFWNAPHSRLELLAEVCDLSWSAADAPWRALAADPLNRTSLTSGVAMVASLQDPHLPPENRAHLEAIGMASVLAVPVWIAGRVVGVINLYAMQGREPYTDPDAQLVSALAQTWVEGLRPGETLDTDEAALNRLTEQLLVVGQTSWVSVHVWTPGDDYTRIIREQGFAEWTNRQRLAFPIERYPTMQSVIQHKMEYVVTLNMLETDPEEYEWIASRGGRSCLMVPLVERGTAIGIVKLLDRDGRLFDFDEIRLAQGIANVVSSAAENARLYQSLESRAKALESAYKELQEADQAKDEFIQNVSHELRTPLISVLGYASLMAEGEFGEVNPQQVEALREITLKAQKLADLVNDIVSVRALETPTFNRQAVDLPTVLAEVIARYEPHAKEIGLAIRTAFPPALAPVLADPISISEAFEKILDNALKFGAGGEAVDIVVQDIGGPLVQVSVRDYGIGIDPSEHQRIFRRFYQVDGGSTRRFGGTGLGLAIAKAIIEGHGGRITVKSRLNEGATFIFTLPKYDRVAN